MAHHVRLLFLIVPILNKLVNFVKELHSELQLILGCVLLAERGNICLELVFELQILLPVALLVVSLWILPWLEQFPGGGEVKCLGGTHGTN